MAIFRLRSRAERRAFTSAHKIALVQAQKVYDQYKHLDTVSKDYDVPGGHVWTAASPEREAWDEYFYMMDTLGFSGWDGQKRFDRELKTK